jgi:hypothetical protein
MINSCSLSKSSCRRAMSYFKVRSRFPRSCATNGNSAKGEVTRHTASGEAHTNVKERWLALDDVSNASYGDLSRCMKVADMRLVLASMGCSIEFTLALHLYPINSHIVSQKYDPKRLCLLSFSSISNSKRCFSMAGTSFRRPTCMHQLPISDGRQH